jgi:PBSX family phage portal protein
MGSENKESSSPPVKRKGKVFRYVYTSRGLFPWEQLRKAEIKKETKAANKKSKQLAIEQLYLTENNLAPPPFDMLSILLLMDNCSYFDACVRQIATDVTGQGYDITEKEEEDVEAAPEEEAEATPGEGEVEAAPAASKAPGPNDAELKRLSHFFRNPNDDVETFEEIWKRAIIDFESVGQMGIEVSRGQDGKIDALFHVHAHMIRVHKDRNKYCQIRGIDKKWFKKFGYEGDVHQDTGDEKNVPEDKRANELIFFVNYYPQSSFYGQPPILPAVGSVRAMIGARDYNLAFFENYGVPAAMVIVEGDWYEENVKLISDFIDVDIKGSANAHKTIVVNPPEGGKVTWEPLVTEIKEGHFKLYHASLIDEVLVPFKMPPYRIGIARQGSLGGNIASEATRVYIESSVNPLKLVTARIITSLVIEKGLENDKFEFWWGDVDLRDINAIANRCVQLFGVGVMNRKQIADEVDVEAPEDEDAERYYISTAYVPLSDAGVGGMTQGRDAQVEELAARVDKILDEAKKGRASAEAARMAAAEARDKIEEGE